jgi:formiminoglutamate deiminase
VTARVRLPAAVNAHSHAFHRLLRGRTQDQTGSFWAWRERMYAAARSLEPESYEHLATAVFAEMVVSGFGAVGEFHYLHHRPDGSPYPDHGMELSLARAAQKAGIRLVLLDSCYLEGGIGQPLNATQRRFSDGGVRAWLRRLADLRAAVAQQFDPEWVRVGAAVHSIRAVVPADLAVIAAELDPDLPLHIHLSEQPAENAQCRAAYGVGPTELLHRSGLLTSRLSAVHATHLDPGEIELLGAAGCSVVLCPTTEADLADGIGPGVELAAAGAALALGTDQHAVVDPWLEMRALEYGERLRSGIRGRFTPQQLLAAATAGGRRSLGLDPLGPEQGAGSPFLDDWMEIRTDTVRTAGAAAEQLPLVATAADVAAVSIGGRIVARNGIHETLGDPADLLEEAIAAVQQQAR